ncbi:MAG: GntR family transcriptional regulator [Proteobacteria bacterium]|nr:MAG: GntR family transcriptional regulator [Pseudomonadota bacterium]
MSPLLNTPVTITDKIFVELRQQIVNGEIVAGAKLSEVELAQKNTVSRAVIREAINRLTACHLVERKANIGARVVTLTAVGLQELYQVREALEGMAARLAAHHMQDDELAELRTLLDNHQQQVQKDENYYQAAGDDDFHYHIILGSHNQHLITMLLDGIYHLSRMYRVQFGMSGPRVKQAFDEHKQIVQAIINRDPELAELLMRRHIVGTKNSVNSERLDNIPKT